MPAGGGDKGAGRRRGGRCQRFGLRLLLPFALAACLRVEATRRRAEAESAKPQGSRHQGFGGSSRTWPPPGGRRSGGGPLGRRTACVIWLQGFNTYLPAYRPWMVELKDHFPHMYIISPKAPLASQDGEEGVHSWFKVGWPVRGGGEGEGIDASVALVQKAVRACTLQGVATSQIVLAGHEQGAALALVAGLRSPDRFGGLVMLSGWVPSDLRDAPLNKRGSWFKTGPPPILWLHGGAQSMGNNVPLEQAELGVRMLKAIGANVEFKAFPDLTATSIVGFPELQADEAEQGAEPSLSVEQELQAKEAGLQVARWLERVFPPAGPPPLGL